MTTDDNSTGDDDNRADTVTHHPDQEMTSERVDDQETMLEQIEKARRRRWVGLREAAHRHPVWMPIGAGVAGLVVGAGVTAALFATYLPPTPALPAAGAALREAPPVGVEPRLRREPGLDRLRCVVRTRLMIRCLRHRPPVRRLLREGPPPPPPGGPPPPLGGAAASRVGRPPAWAPERPPPPGARHRVPGGARPRLARNPPPPPD